MHITCIRTVSHFNLGCDTVLGVYVVFLSFSKKVMGYYGPRVLLSTRFPSHYFLQFYVICSTS
jgi:hypothetical protein